MMVKWANDGLLQANASKMLVNDGEMHFTKNAFPWSKPSFAKFTWTGLKDALKVFFDELNKGNFFSFTSKEQFLLLPLQYL